VTAEVSAAGLIGAGDRQPAAAADFYDEEEGDIPNSVSALLQAEVGEFYFSLGEYLSGRLLDFLRSI